MIKILLVDDNEQRREALRQILTPPEYQLILEQRAEDVVELIRQHQADLLMIGLRLKQANSVDVLNAARAEAPNLPCIVLADGDEMAAEGSAAEATLKLPGVDHLVGPFTVFEVFDKVSLALSRRPPPQPFPLRSDSLVGSSPVMWGVLRLILKMADAPGPLLVVGERGTGKQTIVGEIHRIRQRKKASGGALEVIRCASVSGPRLERQLFGYARGVFPSATHDQEGLFERPGGGGLYLDEIDAIPAWLQTRILGVLEEHQVRRLGEEQARPVEVSLFAGSHKPVPEALIPDLHYLLGANQLKLPPLREHPTDIPELVGSFLAKYRRDRGRVVEYTVEVIELLMNYAWPGNVAELKYVVEQAAGVCEDSLIKADDLPEHVVREANQRGRVFRFRPRPGSKSDQ